MGSAPGNRITTIALQLLFGRVVQHFRGISAQKDVARCLPMQVFVSAPKLTVGFLYRAGAETLIFVTGTSGKNTEHFCLPAGCRNRSAAKGVRSLFFVFGMLSVTFRSLFLMLLSLFSSLICQTPFAGLLLRQGEKNQSQLCMPTKPRKLGVWVSGAEIQASAVDTGTAV